MRLFEYESKEVFREFGIPVPERSIVNSPDEVVSAIEKIPQPVAIKAQVLVGGRGKVWGVKFASSMEEAVTQTRMLMTKTIKGHGVKCVLIEEKLDAKYEYYLGVTIDHLSGKPIVMISTEGGVDIETIAMKKTKAFLSKKVSISHGFSELEARNMCKSLGLKGPFMKVSSILHKLYEVFMKYDATLAEINPLIITNEDKLCAADAKLEIDDNSLFRHPDLESKLRTRFEDEIKIEAIKSGLSYVRLDGNIGVIGSGAGLTMATIDLIEDFGGKAANFLETGGGINKDLMAKAVELVLKDNRLKALLVNLYGGINPMPSAAKGLVMACKRLKPRIPIVVKLIGNEQEKAWDRLEDAGIPVVKSIQTERAVEKLMRMIA